MGRVIGDPTCLCVLLIITFKKVMSVCLSVCLSVCSIREKLLAWFSRDLVEGLSSGQGIIHWFRCRFKYYDKALVLHAYGFGVVEKMKMIFRLGWSSERPSTLEQLSTRCLNARRSKIQHVVLVASLLFSHTVYTLMNTLMLEERIPNSGNGIIRGAPELSNGGGLLLLTDTRLPICN